MTAKAAIRVGSVSFLNAKPLIYSLEESPGIELFLDVPSRLLDGLQQARFDVALLPVIDFQRMEGLRILTSGGIGCDGPTLTVRIFSPVPIHRIRSLSCDTDSHTSVALARVILAERYGLRPEFMELPVGDFAKGKLSATGVGIQGDVTESGAARLLIGDKVITDAPAGLPYQLDLGEAWKQWTGLPFVFAAWMSPTGVELGDLPARLEAAKRQGLRHVDQIIARHGREKRWPDAIARQYLTQYLQFDITPRHLEAISLFHTLAARHGIIPSPARPLTIHADASQ